MGQRVRGALLVVALALVPLGLGCGDDDAIEAAGGPGAAPDAEEALTYVLAGPPDELDPLLAASRPDQILARQIHEPLVERLRGPFGEGRGTRGLVRSWGSSNDRVIWRFELRRRVRFQDGAPFDARAVLANVERWRTLGPGQEVLPELVAADAPRPDRVRFILSHGVADFPQRLATPRLGIVSPAALRPRSGRFAALARPERSGTGPFELRERGPDRTVLARNVEWWGTPLGLGPVLDQVELRVARDARRRVAILRAGAAELADALPASAASRVRSDPLLTYLSGDGSEVLAMERSVRGVRSASAIPPLSEVWLTTVGAG